MSVWSLRLCSDWRKGDVLDPNSFQLYTKKYSTVVALSEIFAMDVWPFSLTASNSMGLNEYALDFVFLIYPDKQLRLSSCPTHPPQTQLPPIDG